MIGFIKKIKKKIDDGMLSEMYMEAKWIYSYVKSYKLAIIFYVFLGILGVVMGLGGSVASKYLIDAVTGYDSGGIGFIAFVMVVMAIGNLVINAVTNRISTRISIKIGNEIRADIYDRIINTDWESMSYYRSGDLLNRLTSDATTVSNSILGWVPSLITKTVQFCSILVVILYYDPTMAVLALLSAPIALCVSKVLMKKMRNRNKEVREISSEMMSFNEETFTNLQSIKAFSLNDVFSDRLRKIQEKFKETTLEYNKFTIYTSSFMSLVGMIVTYSCFGWGVYRLWTGHITYGTMTLFLQLSSSLSSSFSALIGLVPSAISATTAAGRIMEVIKLPREKVLDEEIANEIAATCEENGVSIKLDNIKFKYEKSGKNVLENANIIANPGEIIALIGPSGEGKTTTMRILLGLLNITEGDGVIYNSKDVKCKISASTRKLMAYVPQEKTMFTGTIAENMRMVKADATDEEIIRALKYACAYEFVEKLPEGINSSVLEKGRSFSEGQNQRLSIARALLRNAPVLLLDEATSALDMDTEKRVLKNIMSENLNKTCIVTTHRLSVLSMCHKIYRISENKVQLVNYKDI